MPHTSPTETRDELGEHVRNQVLAAEGKRRGDLVRLTVRGQGEGRARERGGTGRDTSGNKSGGSGASCPNGGECLIHRRGVGTCLMHRAQIEIEVGDATSARIDVGFFSADNLVDREPSSASQSE